MRFRTLALLFMAALGIVLSACGRDDSAATRAPRTGPPRVLTTFYPTTYFTERLAGDAAVVVCPLPADEDPIFWMPPDATLSAYQAADLIVVNGANFEQWVSRVSLPPSRLVDTTRDLADVLLRYETAVEHSHGPSGAHAHEGVDGHTWLDPLQARQQVGRIADALSRLLPDDAASIAERRAALESDLDALHARLAALSEVYAGEAIFASHPAYNYLARRYGWKVVNWNLDPEAMPSDEALAAMRAAQATAPARHLLWESEPLPAIAARLQSELGLASVLFSPCETLSDEERASGTDYLTVMRANVERLVPVLRPVDR